MYKRQVYTRLGESFAGAIDEVRIWSVALDAATIQAQMKTCLLYTSDAADDLLCVDLGGRRIIKKKTPHNNSPTIVADQHIT